MQRIAREEFVRVLRDAAERGDLRNHTGYDVVVAAHIKMISGHTLTPSREVLQTKPGDVVLYCGQDPHSQYLSYEYMVAEVPDEPR